MPNVGCCPRVASLFSGRAHSTRHQPRTAQARAEEVEEVEGVVTNAGRLDARAAPFHQGTTP